ncbi:proline--tRNA ligase [[Mycoplasma] mobile]|uniref:Proline--tRNA ligase n=1 Tax=Mycoplasma mobile (strain ATCC 43663 / 163K / NCTC 11711) TaxID=267748 RepID=SYP_MYCM1|nr:proline--tRNA ligase [[Mycoplasma] mobile]Q6KIE6.1 RecName: Full=Proline--tRNA ligase; AltName: Full=Prolyl-tRNA synthetase; Short=ProRS [Mycoplasma mobile 163K]AAT27630.1 prolyl-tRNA synthetase [Mycoplasma mobile 163K]
MNIKLLDKITPLEQDFAKWYTDVITKGNLATYGVLKGNIVFMPNSYGIWENVQSNFNKIIKELNVKNLYLPTLIPESLINSEKDHVQGFAPELITVEKVGDKVLNEKLFLRPTSEVLFAEYFKTQLNSYNDLPLLLNQWANVFRWEKTTSPFLRNSEFLWQEGHTSHYSEEEAHQFSKKMIQIYANFFEEFLAIPVIIGQKTESEKFAGAHTTYTIEAMMKDGRALQSGTSHYLGQNFAKAFDISFKDKDNSKSFVYQTSWGISTRLIGAIIMVHGDNRGIIMPPKIATNQVDIITVFANKNPEVLQKANDLFKTLKNDFRVRINDSNKSVGFKAAQSEIEGTPIRIEIGPEDLKQNKVILIRRDTQEKIDVKIDELKSEIFSQIEKIHENLLMQAKRLLNEKIVDVEDYESLKKEIAKGNFVRVPFDGDKKEEEIIKKETFATPRCIPLNFIGETKKCIMTNKETKRYVIFAKSY